MSFNSGLVYENSFLLIFFRQFTFRNIFFTHFVEVLRENFHIDSVFGSRSRIFCKYDHTLAKLKHM